MAINDKLKTWKEGSFDKFLSRPTREPDKDGFISGESFDARLDEMAINRVVQFKDIRKTPQGNDPGKTYWDGENKKLKIWIDSIGQWADIEYTSTSTSTTSSSTSSTSTSSTSSSTSSTSSSSSSSSTSTT